MKILLGILGVILLALSIYIYIDNTSEDHITRKNTFTEKSIEEHSAKIENHTKHSQKPVPVKQSSDKKTEQTASSDKRVDLYAHDDELANDGKTYHPIENQTADKELSHKTLLEYEKNLLGELTVDTKVTVDPEEANISSIIDDDSSYQENPSPSPSLPLTDEVLQKAEENMDIDTMPDIDIPEDKGLDDLEIK
jgi:hypothetical protein